MPKIKVRKNNRWANANVKRWTGTRWANAKINKWNGSSWKEPYVPPVQTTQTHTQTYTATWSETYDGDGNVKRNSDEPSGNVRITQGKYGHNNTIDNIYYNPIYFGVQRGLIGFNNSRIQSDLSGSTIKKIEVYLYNEHFWYLAGGTASIIGHNFSNKPNKFNYVSSIKEERWNGRGSGKWITLPTSVGNDLRSGRITGLGVFKNSSDLNYYGHFTGASGSNPPKIRVTYTKNYYVYDTGKTIITNKPTVTQPKSQTYTVRSGDTLWGIAQHYNVTVSEIQTWNNLTSSLIHVGDVLSIYNSSTSVAPASKPQYTSVIAGEGLVQVTERLMRQGLLSQDFSTARQTLMSLNGYTTSAPLLHPGDQVMYSRG